MIFFVIRENLGLDNKAFKDKSSIKNNKFWGWCPSSEYNSNNTYEMNEPADNYTCDINSL